MAMLLPTFIYTPEGSKRFFAKILERGEKQGFRCIVDCLFVLELSFDGMDVVAVSVLARKAYATSHGVFKVSSQVRRISAQKSHYPPGKPPC